MRGTSDADPSLRNVGSWKPWIFGGAALGVVGLFAAHDARERFLNAPITSGNLPGYLSDLPPSLQSIAQRLDQSGAPISPNDLERLRTQPFFTLFEKSEQLFANRVPHEGWEQLMKPTTGVLWGKINDRIESFASLDRISAALGTPISESERALLNKNLAVKAIFYSFFHASDQLALGTYDSRIPIQIFSGPDVSPSLDTPKNSAHE